MVNTREPESEDDGTGLDAHLLHLWRAPDIVGVTRLYTLSLDGREPSDYTWYWDQHMY